MWLPKFMDGQVAVYIQRADCKGNQEGERQVYMEHLSSVLGGAVTQWLPVWLEQQPPSGGEVQAGRRMEGSSGGA